MGVETNLLSAYLQIVSAFSQYKYERQLSLSFFDFLHDVVTNTPANLGGCKPI